MARQVQFRRGTTADHVGFTGRVAELTVNTETHDVHVHDGVTPGGHPIRGGSGGGGGSPQPGSDFVVGLGINTIMRVTQAQYNGILNPDPNTLYVIVPGTYFLDPGVFWIDNGPMNLVEPS